MARYIVNGKISGMESKQVTDKELVETKDSLVVVILDSGTSDKLYEYYSSIKNIILSGNKLVLINVARESNISKTISTLLSSYRCYNIYEVSNISLITEEYINDIEFREPTYEEVQTFIGGDVTAYSDISNILIGVESLVREGNLTGLQVFLEQHLNSISSLTEVFDYMKIVVDATNSGDLQGKIERLRDSLENALTELEDTKVLNKETNIEKSKLKEDLTASQKELTKALADVTELRRKDGESSPVLKTYTELNTSLIKCKVKLVIYFKEVTQVPYINSLIIALMEAMKLRKLRAKLVIYDSRNGIPGIYKPLNVIGSSEYMNKRTAFTGKIEKFVVVEPNQIILDDILTYTAEPYDVVIVYDRMRQANDIVVGNNVHKFFVVNSSADYNETRGILKINDRSTIITRPGSSIGNDVLDIPEIEDYAKSTDTAKTSKYLRAVTVNSNKILIQAILDKVRIDAISGM